MTRSNAREIACHLVFEMNFNDMTAGEALQTLMEESYYPTLKGETDVYEEKPDGKLLRRRLDEKNVYYMNPALNLQA